MIHVSSLNDLRLQHSWLSVGIFDGVHRGHLEILRPLVAGAHAAGMKAVVLTFEPHPAVVLGGRTDFRYLCTPDERLALLEAQGVDVVITETFTREFANQGVEEFMQFVKGAMGLDQLVIGYDTALGRGREGNTERLTSLGKELGYATTIVPPLEDEVGVISSSRIRQEISAGQVKTATKNLGRYYELSGPVVHGDGRGHLINIPTANVHFPHEKIIPANGIYACLATISDPQVMKQSQVMSHKKILAATNVGVRPTFTPDLPAPTVEAHLLDFDGDIYGKTVSLQFVEYIRPEVKFSAVGDLVDQIQADIRIIRQILGQAG